MFVTPVGQPAELKRKGEIALDRCDVLTVCAAMHGVLYLSPYCHCTFNADISSAAGTTIISTTTITTVATSTTTTTTTTTTTAVLLLYYTYAVVFVQLSC